MSAARDTLKEQEKIQEANLKIFQDFSPLLNIFNIS